MQIDLRGVGVDHGAAAGAATVDLADASKVGGFLGRQYAEHTRMAALRFTFMGVKFDSSFPPLSPLFSG
jgi:hypothetical protein